MFAFVGDADGEAFRGGRGHGAKVATRRLLFSSLPLKSSTAATEAHRMNHTLQVIIEQDKDGYFAYVPELKGCHTQGDSMDEVMEHIKEAVDLYLSTLCLTWYGAYRPTGSECWRSKFGLECLASDSRVGKRVAVTSDLSIGQRNI